MACRIRVEAAFHPIPINWNLLILALQQDHPSLRILSLSGCKLGNDVAAPLFQALERNQHLEELWLQNTTQQPPFNMQRFLD